MKKLLIAPHHDDLLLSVPLTMASFAEAEKPIVVVCFSEESDALLRVCSALHREWGFEVVALGLRESILRGDSIRQCIRPLRGLSGVAEQEPFVELRDALERLVRAKRVVSCLAPLLPVHIDHALCRAAAESIAGLGVAYYEDRPYSQICPHALDRESRGMCSAHPVQPQDPAIGRKVLQALEALAEVVSVNQARRIAQCYESAAPETLHARDPARLTVWTGDALSCKSAVPPAA